MDFIEQLQFWEKGELFQAKVMITIGVIALVVFIAILRGQNEFFKGMLIPLSLLLVVLLGYGGYILQSRSAHVKTSIELYKTSPKEAVKKEIQKHTSDNKMGKTLMKIYPILAILSLLALMFFSSFYIKGLAIGFALLFLSTYIIDNGFVTRSDNILINISETKK